EGGAAGSGRRPGAARFTVERSCAWRVRHRDHRKYPRGRRETAGRLPRHRLSAVLTRARFATVVLASMLAAAGVGARAPASAPRLALRSGEVSPAHDALERESDPVPRTVRVDVIATDKSGRI